jgi:hypothetical protein
MSDETLGHADFDDIEGDELDLAGPTGHLDESDIPATDLLEPTDDEPDFDELRPGDLRGDNS